MAEIYIPYYAIVEIIYKCNLSCKHCASRLNTSFVRENLLSDNEFYDLFVDLKNLGCKYLTLSGGEPLLHPSWGEFAGFLSDNNIVTTMVSNGMLIDDKMAEKIKKSGIRLVALSLDGNEEVHNYIRNNPNAYKNVLSAAKNLKNMGIQVNFITTITTKNIKLLEYIEELVCTMDGDFWQIQIGSEMGSMKKNKSLVIKPEDTKKVVDFIISAKKRNKVKITTSDTIGYCFEEDTLYLNQKTGKVNRFNGCSAGKFVVGIEANGNVKGCLSLQSDEFVEGNIKGESIVDIWQKRDNFTYTRDFEESQLSGGCSGCEYGAQCMGGCSFMALGSTGVIHNNLYCVQQYID